MTWDREVEKLYLALDYVLGSNNVIILIIGIGKGIQYLESLYN